MKIDISSNSGVQIYYITVLFCIRFEKLDITPKSAQKIKPVLEQWMKEAEERYKNGAQNLTEFIGTEPTKKRKRRTSFTPQALEVLNHYFERNTHPSGKSYLFIVILILSRMHQNVNSDSPDLLLLHSGAKTKPLYETEVQFTIYVTVVRARKFHND